MITAWCTPTQVTGGTAAGVAVRLAVVRLAAAQLAAAQLAAQQVAARLAVARLAVARLAAARLVCSAHLMAEQLAVRFAARYYGSYSQSQGGHRASPWTAAAS